MEPIQTMADDPDIAASLSAIEFDVESESLKATYDSTRDPTSVAVLAVVSTALGRAPQTLTPLQTVVDTDALDKLTSESATGPGACDSISFRYDGFQIRVTGEDVIEANPIENT